MTIEILTTEKSDKKAIKRFYKQQRYSAAFKGRDNCYIVKDNDTIIAACMVSYISKNNSQALLHGLVVTPKYQNQGLASLLVQYAVDKHNSLACFAEASLQDFYDKQGFCVGSENQLTEQLHSRYLAYRKHQANLFIFTY